MPKTEIRKRRAFREVAKNELARLVRGKRRTALTEAAKNELARLVRERGEGAVAELLDAHPQTVARGLAGLDLNGTTAAYFESRLLTARSA
jgi:hypothetical protein